MSSIRINDGSKSKFRDGNRVDIVVQGTKLRLWVTVIDHAADEVDVVMDMDIINNLGDGTVHWVFAKGEWGKPQRELCFIYYHRQAVYDSQLWTVEWCWKVEPPTLGNRVGCYQHILKGNTRSMFEGEVDRWIEKCILILWKEEVKSEVLLQMVAIQSMKGKIRLVQDFWELNDYVSYHMGSEVTGVYTETLREWRQMMRAFTIFDLNLAYLQLHVGENLWKYQLVRYNNQAYCLTRLDFELNSALKIMATVLKSILGRLLGLKSSKQTYWYFREELGTSMDKEELFLKCGWIVDHYSIKRQLQIVFSYIKRWVDGLSWWKQSRREERRQ